MRHPSRAIGLLFLVLVTLLACKSHGSASSSGYLTVGQYCSSFCTALCSRCAPTSTACATSACPTRCHYGRSPTMVMDGHDPKVALARTASDLAACQAALAAQDCGTLMSGTTPPACYTIQH